MRQRARAQTKNFQTRTTEFQRLQQERQERQDLWRAVPWSEAKQRAERDTDTETKELWKQLKTERKQILKQLGRFNYELRDASFNHLKQILDDKNNLVKELDDYMSNHSQAK